MSHGWPGYAHAHERALMEPAVPMSPMGIIQQLFLELIIIIESVYIYLSGIESVYIYIYKE